MIVTRAPGYLVRGQNISAKAGETVKRGAEAVSRVDGDAHDELQRKVVDEASLVAAKPAR